MGSGPSCPRVIAGAGFVFTIPLPVSPYSRRPPPTNEPLPLGSGDFEAVSYGASMNGLGVPRTRTTPPPPTNRPQLAPIFHRHVPNESHSQNYGFPPPSSSDRPQHYSSPPAAPHSLSPMAMNSQRGNAITGTGPQRAQETLVIRSRPSMKTGFSILIAGALIGGVIGITMRLRTNDVDSFAAASQHEAPAAVVASAAPPVSTQIVNGGVMQNTPGSPPLYFPPTTVDANAKKDAKADDKKDDKKDTATASKDKDSTTSTKTKKSFGGGAPSHATTPSRATVASAPTPKTKPEPKEKDDGYHEPKNPNASSDSTESAPAPPPVKVAANDKPSKVDKPEKADKPSKNDKPEKPAPSPKKSTDADALLKAAMGETTNTL